MKSNKFNLKVMYHKFFVFLPALIVIMLILMIYVSYWVSYIIPLLQNWNRHISKTSFDYPFALTSSKHSSRTKGLILGISSGIFVILLFINLLRTIFSDPGYFPSPMALEYKIVIKNFQMEAEEKLRDKIRKETEDNQHKISEEYIDSDIEKNILELNSGKKENKKRNYKIKSNNDKDKAKLETDYNKEKKEEETKIPLEDSFKISENNSKNLIQFSKFISQGPICFEEYKRNSKFLRKWDYNENINNACQIVENSKTNEFILGDNFSFLNDTPRKDNSKEAEIDLILKNSEKNSEDAKLAIKEKDNNNKNDDIKNENDDSIFDVFLGFDNAKAFLCGACIRLKLERSHHCKQCGKCVLKMDHHCPWLANCIGYNNYKFFLLTHLYGTISCFIVLCTYWETFVNLYPQVKISIFIMSFHLFVYITTLGLFIFLVWLLVVNWSLMFQGMTVIENADRERFPSAKFSNQYDLGYYKNFKNVLGENPFLWFLPIATYDKYNGYYFEKNDQKFEKFQMIE